MAATEHIRSPPHGEPRGGMAVYLVTTSLPFIIEEWPGKLQKKL